MAHHSRLITALGDKAALRTVALSARKEAFINAGPLTGVALAERVAEYLLKLERRPGLVAAYISMRDEIDTQQLIYALRESGFCVALPVIEPGPKLIFRLYASGTTLHQRRFGLSEPGDDCAEVYPDVVLVPLLAFDAAGNRLGYGAGYYDAGLAALRTLRPTSAVGVAFDEQEMADIPHESHDQRLDAVITPSRTILCGT